MGTNLSIKCNFVLHLRNLKIMDLFEKVSSNKGPLGQYSSFSHGYFMFPKLTGEIGARMKFRGKEHIIWSLNNYLGLANDPEVRAADAQAAKDWGLGYPMGACIMSGYTDYHENFENELASFVGKEGAVLLNFGYQGMVSAIDALVNRRDVIVYDAESHGCIIDGVRLHQGKRYVYKHNDMENLRIQLKRATNLVNETGGSILVITEGVFSMGGDLADLQTIVEMKKEFNFRLFIDDAHGFGTMGKTGAGTGDFFGVQDGVDIYFSTFAKSMASIGAFIASDKNVVEYLRYNARSQLHAKSLPMPLVFGNRKRFEIMKEHPELIEGLWDRVNKLQLGLKERGFNLGKSKSPVTPVYLSGSIPEAANMIIDLRENYGVFCSAVMYPVIPKGQLMLRLSPSILHTDEDIQITLEAFSAIHEKLEQGIYLDDKSFVEKLIKENAMN
jgi:glycine C-acetyltransferase